MSDTIRIDLLSHAHHLNQPLTGFYSLAKKDGMKLEIRDCSQSAEYAIKKTALVAYLDDRRLVYDMADGYQSPKAMEYLLNRCDAYFKRSFSDETNREMGYSNVYPYGLNYDVTWLGNPLLRSRYTSIARFAKGLLSGAMISPSAIETKPDVARKNRLRSPKILYMVRLWPEDPALSEQENEERRTINEQRIRLIRAIKRGFGDRLMGGVADNKLARAIAPDLIMPRMLTNRNAYLQIMKRTKICIATTGLHGSIGGKLGEYVAASRAIVSEPLRYSVPGDFLPKKNYLEFDTIDGCLRQIDWLLEKPERIMEIQNNNCQYYRRYLEPERMIRNTLSAIGIEK